jgi:hypothetical protein
MCAHWFISYSVYEPCARTYRRHIIVASCNSSFTSWYVFVNFKASWLQQWSAVNGCIVLAAHRLRSPGCGGHRRGSSLQPADATTTNMYLRGRGVGRGGGVGHGNTENTVRGMRGSISWRRCQNGTCCGPGACACRRRKERSWRRGAWRAGWVR